jgi:hypothetical protein
MSCSSRAKCPYPEQLAQHLAALRAHLDKHGGRLRVRGSIDKSGGEHMLEAERAHKETADDKAIRTIDKWSKQSEAERKAGRSVGEMLEAPPPGANPSKGYGDMSNVERHELAKTDPERFARERKAWLDAGP